MSTHQFLSDFSKNLSSFAKIVLNYCKSPRKDVVEFIALSIKLGVITPEIISSNYQLKHMILTSTFLPTEKSLKHAIENLNKYKAWETVSRDQFLEIFQQRWKKYDWKRFEFENVFVEENGIKNLSNLYVSFTANIGDIYDDIPRILNILKEYIPLRAETLSSLSVELEVYADHIQRHAIYLMPALDIVTGCFSSLLDWNLSGEQKRRLRNLLKKSGVVG